MKKQIIKRYYLVLVGSMLAYLIGTLVLAYVGIWKFEENIFLYLAVTFLYYLVVKNFLAKETYKKLAELDPNIKKELQEREKLRKDKLALLRNKKETDEQEKRPKKWYYNNLIMVPLYLLLLAGALYWLFQKGFFS